MVLVAMTTERKRSGDRERIYEGEYIILLIHLSSLIHPLFNCIPPLLLPPLYWPIPLANNQHTYTSPTPFLLVRKKMSLVMWPLHLSHIIHSTVSFVQSSCRYIYYIHWTVHNVHRGIINLSLGSVTHAATARYQLCMEALGQRFMDFHILSIPGLSCHVCFFFFKFSVLLDYIL